MFPVALLPPRCFGSPSAEPASALGAVQRGPIESVSDLRAVDGASREIDNPAGDTFRRQISADSVEPTVASLSRNLLSHKDRRSESCAPSGTEQAKYVGPQMPWIGGPEPLAGCAERLTGTGSGPNRSGVRPASKSSCKGPDAGACEKVDLRVAFEIIGLDILDGAIVDIAGCDQPVGDQAAQHIRRIAVELVVVGSSHRRGPP